MHTVNMVLLTAVSALLPFSPTLYVLIPLMFLQGMPLGYLDNGKYVVCN